MITFKGYGGNEEMLVEAMLKALPRRGTAQGESAANTVTFGNTTVYRLGDQWTVTFRHQSGNDTGWYPSAASTARAVIVGHHIAGVYRTRNLGAA